MSIPQIQIYILKLAGSKYYVGQSVAPQKRIDMHKRGKGSAWTKKHHVLKVVTCFCSGTENTKTAEQIENKITLQLMIKFGWKNVRGGFWSITDEGQLAANLRHHNVFDVVRCHSVFAANQLLLKKGIPLQLLDQIPSRESQPSLFDF